MINQNLFKAKIALAGMNFKELAKAIKMPYQNLTGGKCWSVRDLVSKANIQPKAYYDIKAGKDTLNIKTVGKIAKALDVDVTELLILD